MPSVLACINTLCASSFSIDEVIYTCPRCGALVEYRDEGLSLDPHQSAKLWRARRMSNLPVDQSGVWRFRELLAFANPETDRIVTLREGNTPLLDAPRAAAYAGLDSLTFKHQGFNPTGSFKDNGMTAGSTVGLRLGMKRVACVSTGNTSASMAAYAAAAGMTPIIFLPHGNISYGKLAQALEYGALTLQVEANFDQILALVRVLADELGIYLLNSVNPFRIEGQKTIMVEMMDQLDWRLPDWVVVPGGNLGNISAFGKAFRELKAMGFVERLPRFAVVQAEGSAPFSDYFRDRGEFQPVTSPETLATAIRIGDPVSWPKAIDAVDSSSGVVCKVSEQEIADAKAVVGQCGIGCEPASAATLAGLKQLVASGQVDKSAAVVAVLTGNVLKDPDYIFKYHTGQLKTPAGALLNSTFGNAPVVVPNEPGRIADIINQRT
ncbi:MAG: threonine synthase [Candidatus Solibacter sp.]|nr:threonine synthase [Candidatus Solibacter sp.]